MAMMIERRSSDAIKMQCKRGISSWGRERKARPHRVTQRGQGSRSRGRGTVTHALRFRIGTSGSPNASTSTSWRTAAGFSVTVDDEAVTGDLLAVAALSRYAGDEEKKRDEEREGAQQ